MATWGKMSDMKIVIIGAGAVGGYFGALLHEAGADVTLIARGATLEILRERGIHVKDQQGQRTVAVPAASSFHELEGADVVLVATKALAGGAAPGELLDAIPADAMVAITQNAVEAPQIAADVVGTQRVWPGVVRGFFIHSGPAAVEYRGGPLSYTFGTWGTSHSGLAEDFATALNAAGIDAQVHPDIWVDMWEKAMFVTTFGALGACVDKPLGTLRTDYRSTLEALMYEVRAVAGASGVELSDDVVGRTMAFADQMPADSTSSMQRDLASGGDSELDAQVGAIVRAGTTHQVDVRLHDFIYTALRNRGRVR